jgi:hypothetical protein
MNDFILRGKYFFVTEARFLLVSQTGAKKLNSVWKGNTTLMNKMVKFVFLAIAFSFLALGADSTLAQGKNYKYKQERKEARREYRREVREARREYREDIRDARRYRNPNYRNGYYRNHRNGYYRNHRNGYYRNRPVHNNGRRYRRY